MVKSLLKITAKLKSQIIQNVKNTAGEILTLLTKLFQNVSHKRFFKFPFRLLFQYKSPVTCTTPLALYRETKKRSPYLTFRQVKPWSRSKDAYTLHKPVRYNFLRNKVIVTGIDAESLLPGLMISGKQIWWTSAHSRVLTRDTNFYWLTLTYFRNLLGSSHFKTCRESLQSSVFSQSWISVDPLKSYRRQMN